MSSGGNSMKWMATFVIGLLLGASAMYLWPKQATPTPAASQADTAAMVKSEVQRLLKEEGILDEAIASGIENYIKKQRAQAEQQRAQASAAKAKNMRPVSAKDDHIYGDPNAPISLVEYSDYECPFCKRFHPTAKQLVDNNPGKVNWVYRYFPLQFHNPGAQKEAEAAECAAELGGNDAFWRYTDTIYERTTSNGKGFPIANLVPLAKEIGLDTDTFKTCLDSGKMAKRVEQDLQNGAAAGVSGTPANILIKHATGQVVVASGALPLVNLQTSLNGLWAAKVEAHK